MSESQDLGQLSARFAAFLAQDVQDALLPDGVAERQIEAFEASLSLFGSSSSPALENAAFAVTARPEGSPFLCCRLQGLDPGMDPGGC